jgi:glycosyltransferase involved in cell wall biosynthesis/SAM-dependent methyltransferase
MHLCTIIAKNYLSQARVLAESFLRHQPDGEVAVLIIDDFEGYVDPAGESFEVIGIDGIGLDRFEEMAASYDVTELSTAVKPWLLRHLLERSGCDAVTYLDPDIWILNDLEEIERLALSHGLVLNPHLTAPPPRDGLKPSEEDILIAGVYNLGFISLADHSSSERFLDWWSEHLRRDCVVDPDNGYFVDQRWVDLVPGIWPDHFILRDPGYNLAYWNLPNRELRFDHGRYTVDGKPLRFFHFSGFDPLHPEELSRHQSRIEVPSRPPLARICGAYADALLAAGYEEARAWPYSWDELPGGVRLDQFSRRLCRRALSEGRMAAPVFSRKGAKQLLSYLTEPDDGAAAESGISRYLGEIHRSREDLMTAFPDLAGQDAPRFREWMLANADALALPQALRPAPTAGRRMGAERNGAPPVDGVNLAGYLGSELGVGEAARQLRSAIAEAGVETASIELPPDAPEMTHKLRVLSEDETPFGVNLICVNADMVSEFAGAAAPSFFADRYSVGMWFWEVGRLPERSRGAFEHLDEVWVASRHVADAIRPDASIPVETIRLPVTPEAPDPIGREALGMPEDYSFLFIFDHRSVLKRKNPLGVIEAFTRAFDPGTDVSLVIKCIGGEDHPDEASRLRRVVADHPHVHLIETMVGPGAKNAMIANCDCYISLHRSEGFGLTLAEAMHFGKPVIATGYSGNLDFMTGENSYLVAHTMTPVGDDADPYLPEAVWAEPDLDHAARLMQHVVDDPEEAARTGERAAADLRRTHSPRAAGAVIEARLKEISGRSASLAARPPARPRPHPGGDLVVSTRPSAHLTSQDTGGGRAHLQHLLGFDQAPPRPGAGRLRRAMKRVYLRLLRPYAAYQRRINESTTRALDEVRAELGGADNAQQATLSRLQEHVEKLTADVQATLEADRALVDQLARDQAELRATVSNGVGELRDHLERLTADVQATLQADQARVDQLARDQAELAAAIGGAVQELEEALGARGGAPGVTISDLERRLTEAEELVEASAAPPFMSGSRFGIGEHDGLGAVLGFTDPDDAGGSGIYRRFEDVFRGSEEMIRERQRTYLDLVSDSAPVLDVGCGRGEFLDLLRDAGVQYAGVDIDEGMIARCREKGHSGVVQADAIEHMGQLPVDSVGTVFSAQMIEHLGFERLQRLLELSIELLRPGGLFIAETVNPHSPKALKTFWVDPTHEAPLFPEAMLALCQAAGYASAFVFCPNGSGDYERDRRSEGEYAIVAHAPNREDGEPRASRSVSSRARGTSSPR